MNVMILSDGEAFATLTVILMLVPVFILACGFYCIYLMKRKGYSLPVLWFFCGFFLNIIGILICGLMPEMNTAANPNVPIQHYDPQYQPANQPPILNEQNAVTCPHCLELTPKSSQFCIKCGCKLN